MRAPRTVCTLGKLESKMERPREQLMASWDPWFLGDSLLCLFTDSSKVPRVSATTLPCMAAHLGGDRGTPTLRTLRGSSRAEGRGGSCPLLGTCRLSVIRGGLSPREPLFPRVTRPPFLCPGKEKPGVGSDELSRSNFEVGFRPQKSVKAGREQQPQAGEARQQGGGLAGGSEAAARLARPLEGGPSVSAGPGWCSAFYEADCFSADVHRYVKELARQKAAGGAAAANAQGPVSPGLLSTAGGEGARPQGAVGREDGFTLELPGSSGDRRAPVSPTPGAVGHQQPPRWSGPLPACPPRGFVLICMRPPHLGKEMAFLSSGSWPPGDIWQEVTSPWGPQSGLGIKVSPQAAPRDEKQHRSTWPVAVSSGQAPGGVSGGQRTLRAAPAQGQPGLLPGQQGEGTP